MIDILIVFMIMNDVSRDIALFRRVIAGVLHDEVVWCDVMCCLVLSF